MFLKYFKKIFLISFIFTSCASRYSTNTASVQDFILDSYKISEGKYAILEMEGLKFDELNQSLLKEKEDVIEEKDVLNIEIDHPTRLDLINILRSISHSNGFEVIDDKIYIPNLDSIEVANLTLQEAKEKIKKRFLKEIKNIEVFVSYKKKRVKTVQVAGLVSNVIPIDQKTRLFDVLSKVNIQAANLFKSYIVRKNNFLAVDFYKLLKLGDMSQNIVMENEDKIYIAASSSSKVMIMGEVARQCAIDIPDGSISLKQALAEVGGLLPSANKSYIQIFRTNVKNPKIYLLDWQHIAELPNRALLLMADDIVYVSMSPITQWNRFVTQILPSISLMDSAFRGFKNFGIIIDGQ
ncbi:MAG: hypothetical protein K940chlam1_00065 [Candidatus Anoxychlamydiales bacterium]|nr:hypothetical protein [Candidatus Anoxychlamydiales bacterium]NGX36047.1 hypothetical protein [Candidatus Anoxychlamydiales bacterium]